MIRKMTLGIFALLLTSCSSMGPQKIALDRNAYNDMVRQSDREQLFSNLIHLRYYENPSYLKIINVTTSYSVSQNLSLSPSWGSTIGGGTSSITRSYGASPSISYSDSPTISYMPMNDASFLMAQDTPISFNTINLLLHDNDSNIGLIFAMLFHSIGPVDYNCDLSDLDIKTPDESQIAHRLFDLLISLSKQKDLLVSRISYNKQIGFRAVFKTNSSHLAEIQEFKRILNVPENSDQIIFLERPLQTVQLNTKGDGIAPEIKLPNNIVTISPRSLYEVMSFLSHGVQLPNKGYENSLISQEKKLSENYFDWSNLTSKIINIYSSEKEPAHTFVKLKIKENWFYIKNDDVQSKMVFAFLIKIMDLTAGLGNNGIQTMPVLTIGVK